MARPGRRMLSQTNPFTPEALRQHTVQKCSFWSASLTRCMFRRVFPGELDSTTVAHPDTHFHSTYCVVRQLDVRVYVEHDVAAMA